MGCCSVSITCPTGDHPRMVMSFVITLLLAITGCEASRGSAVSPRMEFPEWKPLGRGDPLKDPTNEYLPPVLDKVHYWLPTTTQPTSLTQLNSQSDTTDRTQPEAISSRIDNYEPLLRYRTTAITPSSGYLSHHHHHLLHHHHHSHHHHDHHHHHNHPQIEDDEYNSMMMPPPPVMLVPPPAPTSGPWASGASQSESSGSLLHAALLLEASSLSPRTTTLSSATELPPPQITTDPLFSHYKQPPEALKGPMYLIIQGHSKVKKYGAAKVDPISGISIRHSNQVKRKLA